MNNLRVKLAKVDLALVFQGLVKWQKYPPPSSKSGRIQPIGKELPRKAAFMNELTSSFLGRVGISSLRLKVLPNRGNTSSEGQEVRVRGHDMHQELLTKQTSK